MAKYPGISILYEVGTRADIAKSYGVSERTVYRWMNKARKESGERMQYPGAKKIANFKGTRAQMAEKYGVSERTVYRWLNKAKAEGAAIETRTPKSKYPGSQFEFELGTNKELAGIYGVSERTISRWRKRAKKENIQASQEPEELGEMPEEIFEEPETGEEIPEDEFEGWEEPEAEESQQGEPDYTEQLINLLLDSDLISDSSLFRTLRPDEMKQYMEFYIQYQYDMDEHQFYNEETHKIDFSPEFVATINIWGEEFEDWVIKQYEYSVYGDSL